MKKLKSSELGEMASALCLNVTRFESRNWPLWNSGCITTISEPVEGGVLYNGTTFFKKTLRANRCRLLVTRHDYSTNLWYQSCVSRIRCLVQLNIRPNRDIQTSRWYQKNSVIQFDNLNNSIALLIPSLPQKLIAAAASIIKISTNLMY